MLLFLKQDTTIEELDALATTLKQYGVTCMLGMSNQHAVAELGGNVAALDSEMLKNMDIVEDIRCMEEPYRLASKRHHPEDTVVQIGEVLIGNGHFQTIAGPCSVESREQLFATAEAIKAAGATMLRGGAFKPRTSPYSFQGLREEGIHLLLEAKAKTGLPVVSEILESSQLPIFADIDVIQVGARSMQNYELLKELGKTDKPVLLKRGLANTVHDLLMSAEYILAGGNPNVILCERGIRTFEQSTRNTLDIGAIPVLKSLTHLPVIVDPSHAAGQHRYVAPLARAAVAAGCDGLIIEVHTDPHGALCDGAQALTPPQFADLQEDIRSLHPIIQRTIARENKGRPR